ncbi:MAG TPA: PH domain-containing protein [Acidimicrobiia bacterium]|nr:PH domain-containing protein [Acidimicrobiia bacterium]
MAYPQDLLAPGESIVFEFGAHWFALLKEALVTVAYVVLLILLVPDGVNGWAFTIITALWLWIAVGGFVGWRTRENVITTERFVVRAGMARKVGYEIPLEVITDVAFRQNLIERAVGVGDMVIQTAGSAGRNRLTNIPDPEKVKSMLVETRRNRTNSMSSGRQVASPALTAPGKSSAEQLEILGRLFDQGKLTQREYDAEKQKLLG